MSMIFEWDEAKAVSNEQKHGVGFHEAVTVFEDPLSLTIVDEAHSKNEQRLLT